MVKFMTLIKSPAAVDAAHFRRHWDSEFLPRFCELPTVRDHLLIAKHNYVLPAPIREQVPAADNKWAGAGCYYFDSRAMAEAVLASAEFRGLIGGSRQMLAEVIPLLVDEVWVHNRDRGYLPIKAFAFFKRLPTFTRLQALQYYQGPHAAVGDRINKGRTVRYIQNHVLLDFQNPAPHDYDGGPEIWFKSMDIAMDLYADSEGMGILAEDEAKFVKRGDLIHFLAEESQLYNREIPDLQSAVNRG